MMMFARVKGFVSAIYHKRAIIFELAKRDFQQQYMGSYLGFVWVFLQPLLFIVVLYSVFTFGFRKGAATGIPYSVFLVSGMIAWMYFSNLFVASSGVIRSHRFLLNRADFRLSILPIVKMLSALVPHFFFILLAVVVSWINGFAPSLYTMQVLYYLLAMIALLLGLGWISSSTSLFVNDVSKIVAILVQFGFWLTPIFWDIHTLPLKYQWVVKLNPVCYIISGYRDSLVYQVPFWSRPVESFYFWVITLLILFLGITVFSKLRPHFAEVA